MKEITISSTIKLLSESELDKRDMELVSKAKEATERSYSPYSRFSVGAAVRLSNGVIFQGCNQENAAYTNGICAERSAIFGAHAQYPGEPILSIAIAAQTEGDFVASPVTPCGACRQVMVEIEAVQGHPIRTLLYGRKGTYLIEDGMKALMPLQFDPEALEGM